MNKVYKIIKLLPVLLLIPGMVYMQCAAAPPVELGIIGLQDELLKDTKTKLNLILEDIERFDQKNINDFCLSVPSNIKQALKYYGYFKSDVMVYKPGVKSNKWYITIAVKLGPPLRIGTIDLKVFGPGSNEQAIIASLRGFPLKSDDLFQVATYNNAKKTLLKRVDELGYPKAFFSNKKVEVNLTTNAANILLYLNTNTRFYFGKTTFNTGFFDDDFLLHFLPYKSGEYYSHNKLYELQKNMSNSGFFQTVNIKTAPLVGSETKIPVEITIIPKKAQQYNAGVGYGTDTGVRGSFEANFRYLTRTAHSLQSVLQMSEVQKNIVLHYLVPEKTAPTTNLYDVSIAVETLDLDKSKSTTGMINASYTSTLAKDWRQIIGFNLHHEHYKLAQLPYVTSNLLIGYINWSCTKKDHLLKPNKGYNINLKLQGSNRFLISSSDFIQMQLNVKYMHTFFKKTQVILHGIAGYTMIDNINDLPLSLQFYTGGTKSIRGFGYNTIGPGTNMVVGGITLRQRVFGDWYVEGFFDRGNVGNSFTKKLAQGGGVGIVWRTAIGTLALSYAKATSQPGMPGRIEFSMGPEL